MLFFISKLLFVDSIYPFIIKKLPIKILNKSNEKLPNINEYIQFSVYTFD